MRKLTLFMHTTLDGFIATTESDIGIFNLENQILAFSNEVFGAMDAIVFSRTMYEGFVDYWDETAPGNPSTPPGELEFSRVFGELQRVVVSRKPGEVGNKAVLIGSDLARELGEIKSQPGRDLILIAGPDLATACLELGLLDRVILNVFPIVLGQGVPLFRPLSRKHVFNLVSSQIYPSGVVSQRLDVSLDPTGN